MPKIEIYKSDMSDEMQREALHAASLAVNMYKEDNDIARYIKKEFDRKHGNTWQCIIGSSGYSVTHNPNSYIDFSVDDKKITLFKTG